SREILDVQNPCRPAVRPTHSPFYPVDVRLGHAAVRGKRLELTALPPYICNPATDVRAPPRLPRVRKSGYGDITERFLRIQSARLTARRMHRRTADLLRGKRFREL